MDAMLLEQQIQIGVGEAAGAPVLLHDDLARLRREFAPELAAPRSILEGLSRSGRLLNRRDILPALVVAGAISAVQHIEDTKP